MRYCLTYVVIGFIVSSCSDPSVQMIDLLSDGADKETWHHYDSVRHLFDQSPASLFQGLSDNEREEKWYGVEYELASTDSDSLRLWAFTKNFLEQEGYLSYLDWKSPPDEVIWSAETVADSLDITLPQCTISNEPYTDPWETLEIYNAVLVQHGLSCILLEQNCDCYILALIESKDSSAVKTLATKLNSEIFIPESARK